MVEFKFKLLRYYIRDSVVFFEEDMYYEFKGYRNLFVEELFFWIKELSDGRERVFRRVVFRYYKVGVFIYLLN